MLMRSNTTNTNPTPTNVGQTPSSLSHTSIPVETFDYLIRNQQTNVNSSNVQPQDLSFPLPIVISIIIGTIVAAGVVLGAYYNLKSDITALSVRIDTLDKDFQSANMETLKKDIIDTRSEIKNIQHSISNYNFKSINDDIIKININIDNIKSEINKINDKQISKMK